MTIRASTQGIAPKLCKDCKSFRTLAIFQFIRIFGSNDWCEYARCAKSRPQKVDLVGGNYKPSFEQLPFCEFVRDEESACGKDGKWWESK